MTDENPILSSGEDANYAVSAESTLGGLDAIIDASRCHPDMGEVGVVIALGRTTEGAYRSGLWMQNSKGWTLLDVAKALAGLVVTFPQIAKRTIHEGSDAERRGETP